MSSTAMEVCDEEVIEILNVSGKQCRSGTGNRNGRTRPRPRRRMDFGGNQSRSGRVVKSASRRRIGSLQQFSMFYRHGNVRRANVGANVGRALNEREKFSKSVEEFCNCIGNLDLTWKERPYFRCSGVRRPKQKLVCLYTFRFKKVSASGEWEQTIVVSVVIEE